MIKKIFVAALVATASFSFTANSEAADFENYCCRDYYNNGCCNYYANGCYGYYSDYRGEHRGEHHGDYYNGRGCRR